MTAMSDITREWSDAIVDLGPVERRDHSWGIVGSIPEDGHVVLAVSPTSRPTPSPTSTAAWSAVAGFDP